MKVKLLSKLSLSLAVLGVVLTVVISIFSYANSKSYLEDMYAKRVLTGAKNIAAMLKPNDVRKIISKDGAGSEIHKDTMNLFNTLKEDGEVTFLSLVVPDEDSVTFYIDACVPRMGDDPKNQIPYGSDILYKDAASDENDLKNYEIIWNYYAKNKGVPIPLVTDNDYGYNYTAVAPILDENGKAIAEIQYILDMRQVRSYLHSVLFTMLVISFLIISTGLFLYMLFTKKVVVKPIDKLANFTQGITKSGEFKNHRITLKTGDEIEELGNSYNFMLEKLEKYIDNLSAVTAEKERIGTELSIATDIQANMLPSIFPAFPERKEFNIYATMEPAKEVGGDFYDFFLVDDDHLAMIIADVSGKGVPAALFMVIAKTMLKNSAQTGASPKVILEKVNNQLCESNDAEMFVTVWIGILEISTGKMTCANAGHEYPAIKKYNGKYELLKDKHGFVLAGMENAKYREYEITLEKGDSIYVYTDGVAEATDTNKELYGTGRMINALNKAGNVEQKELLKFVKEDIDSFVGNAPQFDDITMLGLTYFGSDKKIDDVSSEITIDATLENLPVVQELIEGKLTEGNCPMKTTMSISVAVEEIYVNIAHYAYSPNVGKATIKCIVDKDLKTAEIQFIDQGKPFNPLEKAEPDITLSAEDRAIGGLGILMVKKSMDEVSYNYENNSNILTVKKKF